MDGPRNYHIKWAKSDRETQILYDITHMWNLILLQKLYKWTYLKPETDIQVYKTNLWLQGEGLGEG